MELSVFLAKLLGLYLLVIAADLVLRKKEFEGAVRDFASSKGLLVFSGSLSILLGLAIAIAHPVYTKDWRGLITLIAYVLILRGAWRIAFPTHFQKKMVACFHKGYRLIFLVLLVVGAFLTYSGFTAV